MKTKILVCNPSHYQINYEINPWMSLISKVDKNLAIEQWKSMVSILEKLDVEVVNIDPKEGLPDMVFTANGGVLLEGNILLSNFKFSV
jgi:N-dimethylarginine dimethylaminohydrolase